MRTGSRDTGNAPPLAINLAVYTGARLLGAMETQFLFVYGTLKSDQPDHRVHCEPPLSAQPAKARGFLWRLREGYPILQVDPCESALDASRDAVSDWRQAQNKSPRTTDTTPSDYRWIEGELFEFPLEPAALRKMDAWENFTPGVKGNYQRRVIRVTDAADASRLAWAYVCFSPPNWATLLAETSWR